MADDGASKADVMARRALLKLSVYVPPAIIGTLMLGSQHAAAQTSCNPAGCKPATQCGPADGTPCAPNRR